MDKSSVTRTFSIGGICSRTTAKEDFSSTRRHSSAGIRALLWATSSAKSLGCSLGSDSQISRETIFPNILTPDSIPQFTIPSLSVQNSLRSLDREAGEEEAEEEDELGDSGIERGSSFSSSASSRLSSSTSFPGVGLVLSDRRAERSISDPLTQKRSHLQREASCFHSDAHHCLDPTSRAAFSLPHLAKVTTPYGFVTLSQSPQMVNEEALLCQAGLRHLNKDEETACCLRDTTGTKDNKGGLSHRPGDKTKPCNDSENKHRLVKGEVKASTANAINATVSTSASQKQQDSKIKRRFYNVIRKHFTSRHSE